MSRYNTLFDGKHLSDIELANGGFNYYGYLNTDGTWTIMRENLLETIYVFAVGNKNYATNWDSPGVISAAGIALNYKRADKFNFKNL